MWTRRWIEIVAALVFCKVVIVVTFVVGASAFCGTGPSVAPTTASDEQVGLSDMLVGVLLLAIAIGAPWLTWRFVHFTGLEAASVMYGNVAANPVNRVGHSAASTTKFAAQHVALSAATSGASAVAGAARGAGAAGGAGAAAPFPRLSSPDLSVPRSSQSCRPLGPVHLYGPGPRSRRPYAAQYPGRAALTLQR